MFTCWLFAANAAAHSSMLAVWVYFMRTRFPINRSNKFKIGLLVLTLVWTFASILGQSQSAQQPQPSQQSPTPAQTPSKDESAPDASKKAQKDKPKPKKVFTEDDLSSMKGGVSVVGDANRRAAQRTGTADPDGDEAESPEQYWRGRAREILDQIAQVDEAIAKTKDDIKKYGSGGFDVTTGMKDNVAYIKDRNGQLQRLEKRKADLQKQMDDLQEEGRKAGASPSWFR